MVYQLISLLVENFITLLTEFIGMSAGLMMLGLPMWLSVLIGLTLVLSIALYRGYAKKEKIAIIIGLLNVVFIIVACMTKPSLSGLGNAFLFWGVPAEKAAMWPGTNRLGGKCHCPLDDLLSKQRLHGERNHLQGTAQRSDRHCDWLYLSSSGRNVYHHHRRRSVRKNDQSGTGWTGRINRRSGRTRRLCRLPALWLGVIQCWPSGSHHGFSLFILVGSSSVWMVEKLE